MCIVIDLDEVCLICLQLDKQMHCIFEPDVENPDDLQIAEKISALSELKLDQNNESLPNKVCNNCLNDLKAAWRFHKNCQAAKMIFQTIARGNKTPSLQQLEECEDLAAKELAEQKIKVPQGLQIKRIQHDNPDEAGVSKKSINLPKSAKGGESFMNTNTHNLYDYGTDTAKDGSTLFEELASDDFIKHDEENEDDEFQNLADAGDEEDDDEVALIEYYLAEDTGTDEQLQPIINIVPTAVQKKLNKPKVEEKVQLKPIKETNIDLKIKLEPPLETKAYLNKPRIRSRPKQIEQPQELPRSSNQPSRPKILKQTFIQTNPKISKPNAHLSSATSSNSALQSKRESRTTEAREVRTRKRKSVSPDTTKPPKICEICGNSYRFQHALNAHMRRHYNDKPFPCEFCDKAFVSNVELRRHMRVHTGAKPYACQYCERRFSDFGSRIKHERTHTGERPYVCVTCGKSFAYPHVLSVHLRTHTGEKRFRCDHCSKGFTKKAYLQSHIDQHHSNLNYQVVLDDTTDSNQMLPMKSVAFEECIFTTELINDTANDIPEEDEDEVYEDYVLGGDNKIIIRQHALLKTPKREDQDDQEDEDDDGDIHEIVEVHPDEYTIRVR